jgi:hypothetical protein
VVQRLGRPLASDELVRLAVETAPSADVRASFELEDGNRRELVATTCDELVAAIALILGRTAPIAASSADTATIAPPVEAPIIEAAWVTPRARAEWSLGAHAAVVAGIGMLPRVGVGGELAMTGRREQLFAELGYADWRTTADSAGDFAFGLWTIDARVGWRSRRLPIAAWLVGELGKASAVETGTMPSPAVASGYAAVGAGVGARIRVTRWLDGVAAVEGLYAVERPRFEMVTVSVFEPSVVAAQASIGLSGTYR